MTIIVVFLVAGITIGLKLRSDMGTLEVTEVTPDVYMLSNSWGGNVSVLKTGAGAVVVDTLTFGTQGEEIRRLAEELTGEPVAMIINSHYHLDHTHGNPAFDPGTRVLAHERTLHHLQQLDADYFADTPDLLPRETLAFEETLLVGNKTLRIMHPGIGHTDGDVVVVFVEDEVLVAGDLFFNNFYPNIDLEAGGSVLAWGDTLDSVLALPFNQVIPGHGPVSNADGLLAFQAFIRELSELGAYAGSIDGSLEDTIVNGRLTRDTGFNVISFGPFFALDRNFVIERAWQEATGNFELYDGF
jgi:glyoxylase-like metal-dependent hydrolase (beta-lactamase superfamily II)